MTATIAFFNALERLPKYLEIEALNGIDSGIEKLNQHIPVTDVGIAVHICDHVDIDEGVSGIAYCADSLNLRIHPDSPAIHTDLADRVSRLTIHEIHHVLRIRSCGVRDWTAGEVLALEGLALACEEFLGFEASPVSGGISDARLEVLFDRIAPNLHTPKSDWQWIYENDQESNAKFAVLYRMGYRLVQQWLSQTGNNPISAISTPYREILSARF